MIIQYIYEKEKVIKDAKCKRPHTQKGRNVPAYLSLPGSIRKIPELFLFPNAEYVYNTA